MLDTRGHGFGLKRLGQTESWQIVDAAIRKEISWQTARARLVALYELELDYDEDLDEDVDYPA